MSPNPLFENSPAYEPRLWDPLKQYELEQRQSTVSTTSPRPISAVETAIVVVPSTDTNDTM